MIFYNNLNVYSLTFWDFLLRFILQQLENNHAKQGTFKYETYHIRQGQKITYSTLLLPVKLSVLITRPSYYESFIKYSQESCWLYITCFLELVKCHISEPNSWFCLTRYLSVIKKSSNVLTLFKLKLFAAYSI